MSLCTRLVRGAVGRGAVSIKPFTPFSARPSLPPASGSVSGSSATRHFTPSASVHHSFPPSLPDSIPRQESPAKLLKNSLKNKEVGYADQGEYIRGVGQLEQVSVNADGNINLVCDYRPGNNRLGQKGTRPYDLKAAWLRDACQCSACVSESSGQKNFSTVDVPETPTVESCRILEDGALEVVWANDFLNAADDPTASHTSVYSSEFLRRIFRDAPLHVYEVAVEPVLWDWATYATEESETKSISYNDWMAGGPAYATAVLALAKWGLIRITGLPDTNAAVQEVAEKMGHLQSTFYGPTWDVVSKPNAENAAYTNEFLCLHQDLLYYNDSPKIQLLHCLSNDCEGGDSLFSDGLRAAFDTLANAPTDYAILSRCHLLYQYNRNGHHYRFHRRVIEPVGFNSGRYAAGPRRVNWSPPFQGPLPRMSKFQRPQEKILEEQQQRERQRKQQQQQQQQQQQNLIKPIPMGQALDTWHGAARRFRDGIEAPQNMLRYRLQPGDCVVFDNARVLHGRTRFNTASGHRHLRGTYLSEQEFESALTKLMVEGAIDQSILAQPKWRRTYKNSSIDINRSYPRGTPATDNAETQKSDGE